jgi:hypothetical protein
MERSMRADFVAFILTHGRANNVKTYSTLRKHGYTGKVVFVVDNEDDQADEYKRLYGKENVYVFDKLKISKTFDTADNFSDRRCIVYARNACFDIARALGYRYFIELDDDYKAFEWRFDYNLRYKEIAIKNLDKVFSALLDYLIATPANFKTIALMQNGDYFGGGSGPCGEKIWLKRKAMNSFICSVDKPFTFLGRVNEDVNTYTRLAQVGNILASTNFVSLKQEDTQKSKGGMTEMYINSGTYQKTFYTVMYCPSSVKVSLMGCTDKRLHHNISWDNTCPKILDERYKKV